VPRLEATVPEEADASPRRERASFDLPELDAILHGGLPCTSSTLLAGSTGVGKTLTALHFAAAGARRGEPSLYVSFFEPPGTLLARSRAVGLDLEGVIASGALSFRYFSPMEREADQVLDCILTLVRTRKIRRLVIDGIGEIEASICDESRLPALVAALCFYLRAEGTTSVFIKEISKLLGEDVDFSTTPLAVTAENLLFARHVELAGTVRRIFSVLKMRESGHDPSIREFEISQSGLRVLEPTKVHGALTGLGRVNIRLEAEAHDGAHPRR
jgi:circadian clock protein KaiC